MSELCMMDEKILTLKDEGGVPVDIVKVDNPELLPIFLRQQCDMETFNKWLKARAIPDSREGLGYLRNEFGSEWLKSQNFASLSDPYWVRRHGETWKRVNFFTNIYSSDITKMVFKPWEIRGKKINSNSPDITTNGVLRKSWIQNRNTKGSSLVKARSERVKYEPLSEVLVSVLLEKLGCIDFVRYNLYVEGLEMCSICDNFIKQGQALVSAVDFYNMIPRKPEEKVLRHLLSMCEKLDIPKAEPFIKRMIFIDKLTANTDRNLSNIGFLFDCRNNRFIGPAPLYDNGNCYWGYKDSRKATGRLFLSEERKIFEEQKREVDFDAAMNDKEFLNLIETYPYISNEQKETLSKKIEEYNNELMNGTMEKNISISR